MVSELKAFFAYASSPAEAGATIEAAVDAVAHRPGNADVTTWKALDIVGHFIAGEVITGIDAADVLVADITQLNFNVTYEIGYAIGRRKRVYLVRNQSIAEVDPLIREVGIFDTLGYKTYVNSVGLASLLSDLSCANPIDIAQPLNQAAPVYLIEAMYKTDWASRIVSRLKKARFTFRNFDPAETPRLSAFDAIANVSQSHGVVVPLLSQTHEGCRVHNMRGAFIAGLADGMAKPLCMLQNGDDPVPLDYRDLVRVTYKLDDVNEHIAEFSGEVAEALQRGKAIVRDRTPTFLQSVDLGASSAENEMRSLEKYYLATDQFQKALRGEAHLVVGRKGSGKSAVFLQIRDRERSRNPTKNIVLDLKPEGYKLVKFKEMVLQFLAEGTFQHTITAFWEYVLLLEICYKVLEKDVGRHVRDHSLYDPYRKLADLYNVSSYYSEGDFSERVGALIENIRSEYSFRYADKGDVRLSAAQVTELVYQHDFRQLQTQVIEYMKHKEVLWLLFDNIDKGWPTTGLKHEDLLIIRSLIDATRKIQREFSKNDVAVYTAIFLRNDVYELLVRETSDRGKEASVMLDWNDADMLRDLIRLRLVATSGLEESDFQSVWSRLCVSHYAGEESSQFLIDRSLMRPRFLINLISQCKSAAINRGHSIIEQSDIEKGLAAYSSDLLVDVELEINDIAPGCGESLYALIGSKPMLTHKELIALLQSYGITTVDIDRIFDLLLWYGVLGIQIAQADTKYIYDLNYSMPILKGMLRKGRETSRFEINKAFCPALMIDLQ